MDYLNIYTQLIENAKYKNKGNGYYEKHHIKPKSLFPELMKDKNNIVLLTAREHFLAHWLLTKIYPGRSMNYGFLIMCNKAFKGKKKKRDYKVNSRVYERLKLFYRNNSPSSTKEAKEKLSKAKKGKNHHYYGIKTEESPTYKPEKITITHKDGRIFTGSRLEIRNNTNLIANDVSALISKRQYTSKGWSLLGVDKPKHIPNNIDKTVYCWCNKKLNVVYKMTKKEFMTVTGLKLRSVNSVINKERNSLFGWTLIEEEKLCQ